MISVFYNHITEASVQSNLPLTEVLAQVKQADIDGVEINFDELNGNKEIPSQLKQAGLKISSIWQFYSFDSSTDFTKAKCHIDTAAELEVKKILVVPGFLSKEEAPVFSACTTRDSTFRIMKESKTVSQIVSMLKQTVEYASSKNVTVTLEDFDSDNSPCSRMYQLLFLMENVPGLRFTMDTGNFAFSNESALAAYDVLESYISHVHCKDRGVEQNKPQLENNRGLAPIPVGQGYMPIKQIVEKLISKGYLEQEDSYFAIEHFGAPDQLKFMKESAAYLKDICK